MSALEREIIEKFHQLQPAAKQRVRELIEQDIALEAQSAVTAFDYDMWFHDVETLRQQIHAGRNDKPLDVVGLLRDTRDGEDE